MPEEWSPQDRRAIKRRKLALPCNHSNWAWRSRAWKTGLPVRSAVLKPHAGELVVGWVTTSESSLLYVFFVLASLFFDIYAGATIERVGYVCSQHPSQGK
ncbi:hypothetical protein N7461_003716 [Penicillium sp. DV-2018c]|nr:hypothetical protein N7461_003716 [Penicillium sp. DV-2018c]